MGGVERGNLPARQVKVFGSVHVRGLHAVRALDIAADFHLAHRQGGSEIGFVCVVAGVCVCVCVCVISGVRLSQILTFGTNVDLIEPWAIIRLSLKTKSRKRKLGVRARHITMVKERL